MFIPYFLPVNLVCSPKVCPDLQNYFPVGTMGVTIYANVTFEKKKTACSYIRANVPSALPSQSVFLFSTCLPVSAGILFEALTHANIDRFTMKAKQFMDELLLIPPPPTPDNEVRRLDIGYNCEHNPGSQWPCKHLFNTSVHC